MSKNKIIFTCDGSETAINEDNTHPINTKLITFDLTTITWDNTEITWDNS